MVLSQKQIGNNVTINLLKTDKFKSNFISVNYIRPLSAEKAAMNALIPRVLKRGCEQYRDNAALAKRLEELYASDIFCKTTKSGDYQILSFSADMLDNSYSIDGTDIASNVASLLMQLITTPATENGIFSDKYVDDEKQMLIHSIKAQINNKNRYARLLHLAYLPSSHYITFSNLSAHALAIAISDASTGSSKSE